LYDYLCLHIICLHYVSYIIVQVYNVNILFSIYKDQKSNIYIPSNAVISIDLLTICRQSVQIDLHIYNFYYKLSVDARYYKTIRIN